MNTTGSRRILELFWGVAEVLGDNGIWGQLVEVIRPAPSNVWVPFIIPLAIHT